MVNGGRHWVTATWLVVLRELKDLCGSSPGGQQDPIRESSHEILDGDGDSHSGKNDECKNH